MKKITKKINVLFVMLQLDAGGSERVVLDLASNLDKSVFNVYVAFFSGGVLLGEFTDVSQGIFHINKKPGFDPGAMIKISKIIKKNRINVVNSHHYAPLFYSYFGTKILHNRSLIYTEHSADEVEGFFGKHKLICNHMLHNCNSIIGVSREITESFRKKFPSHTKKMICIPNGVDIDRFTIQIDRDDLRAELGLLPSHFVIGTVANFRKVKNHLCLIRAFHLLSKSLPHTRLVLVGRGFAGDPENSEYDIKNLINSFGLENRVILTGYRDDIPCILKTLDTFCLPSLSEGLPVSILEAMASSVPVVGSNVKGINEIISAEETGLLFRSNDDESLAQALQRLIKDPQFCCRLKRKAFDSVSRQHGITQWVSNYQQVFQSA